MEKPILLPEQFLTKDTDKNQIVEFQILAWEDLQMRIEILIYNALYLNHKFVFQNITAVEIRQPSRAIYGTQRIFVCLIIEEYFITLPFNQPTA